LQNSTLVYFYTYNIPLKTGNGFVVRNYSNLRSYVKLGYKITGIYVTTESNPDMKNIDVHFPEVNWEIINPVSASKLFKFQKRIGFWFGIHNKWLLESIFPFRSIINEDIIRKKDHSPNAIYHFESISTACGAYGVPEIKAIWSNHDYVSERFVKIRKTRGIKLTIRDRFKHFIYHKRIKKTEDLIAKSSKLIVTVSESETIKYKVRWPKLNIYLLPISWSVEKIINKNKNRVENGELNLLHLGRVDGFLGSQSLKYILLKVFPLISKELLDKIKLSVVGFIGETELSIEMKNIISTYSNVDVLGFVDDLKPYYANSDLHVVGATIATGSRTRIIESFVFGLPVISTRESADGLIGLENRSNILLADSPNEFADYLINILKNPDQLVSLKLNGRTLYDKYYHSKVVTKKLKNLLNKYVI
jgi:glycosyltransferase involved in cell wall biosynthesis